MLLLLANRPNRLPRSIDLKRRLKSFMLALSPTTFSASRGLDSERADDTMYGRVGRLQRRRENHVKR